MSQKNAALLIFNFPGFIAFLGITIYYLYTRKCFGEYTWTSLLVSQ